MVPGQPSKANVGKWPFSMGSLAKRSEFWKAELKSDKAGSMLTIGLHARE